MKRLVALVVGLALLLMVTSMTMAATNIGGEFDFGYDFERSSDYGYAKLIADNRLNSELNAHLALKFDTIEKNSSCQEAWVEYYEKFGTIRVGYWEYDVKGDVRVLSPISIIGNPVNTTAYIKKECQVRADIPLNEKISLTGFFTRAAQEEEPLYAGGASYKADNWGAEALYIKYNAEKYSDPAELINAYWFPFDSTKVYLHYGVSQDKYGNDGNVKSVMRDKNSAIFGVYYETPDFPVFARFEYDCYNGLYDDGASPWGFVLGYKFRNGSKLQYDRYVHAYSTPDNSTNIVKLITCF